MDKPKTIIVVGGGAGGLELVTKLGNHLGKKKLANIILVDRKLSHVWKPLFHEVAAGYLDSNVNGLSYVAQAREHYFNFKLGHFIGIDRQNKTIQLAEVKDEAGQTLIPQQNISYDYLVMALGSISNDFNTPGVKENCIFLDTLEQANLFYSKLSEGLFRLSSALKTEKKLKIAIVGGGATGVELSAELFHSVQQLTAYGVEGINNQSLDITIIEANSRLLTSLPEKMSQSATEELTKLGVKVMTGTRIMQAAKNTLTTPSGELIEADLIVWAAGVKISDFLKDIAGLESNKINQLLVNPNLSTTRDSAIFAIGDCCACPQKDGSFVPPRAQAAHQMALHCSKSLIKLIIKNQAPKDFTFNDMGSLVSLSKFNTVGKISAITKKSPFIIEGKIARMLYLSLYRKHQMVLHGPLKTLLLLIATGLNKALKPKLKLH